MMMMAFSIDSVAPALTQGVNALKLRKIETTYSPEKKAQIGNSWSPSDGGAKNISYYTGEAMDKIEKRYALIKSGLKKLADGGSLIKEESDAFGEMQITISNVDDKDKAAIKGLLAQVEQQEKSIKELKLMSAEKPGGSFAPDELKDEIKKERQKLLNTGYIKQNGEVNKEKAKTKTEQIKAQTISELYVKELGGNGTPAALEQNAEQRADRINKLGENLKNSNGSSTLRDRKGDNWMGKLAFGSQERDQQEIEDLLAGKESKSKALIGELDAILAENSAGGKLKITGTLNNNGLNTDEHWYHQLGNWATGKAKSTNQTAAVNSPANVQDAYANQLLQASQDLYTQNLEGKGSVVPVAAPTATSNTQTIKSANGKTEGTLYFTEGSTVKEIKFAGKRAFVELLGAGTDQPRLQIVMGDVYVGKNGNKVVHQQVLPLDGKAVEAAGVTRLEELSTLGYEAVAADEKGAKVLSHLFVPYDAEGNVVAADKKPAQAFAVSQNLADNVDRSASVAAGKKQALALVGGPAEAEKRVKNQKNKK